MAEPHVVVLGGGPAGCGAAYQLRRRERARVTLVEQNAVVGGNAGSFLHAGIHLDYGSHRLHAACDSAILADIQALLGDDLADRERHGRILLRGRFVHFPLNAKDLLLRLDRAFAAGALRDMLLRALGAAPAPGTTFASVLQANLGPTICQHFYFPYARKIWGRAPEELSGIQARKRVTAGTFAKLIKRLASPPGKGRFYYPRRGYGQLSQAYADAAASLGATLLLGWRVAAIARTESDGGRWRLTVTRGNEARDIVADHVWSTLPATLVARMMQPAPPPAVLAAAAAIGYRAMVLAYLELDCDQYTTTDAHYFPEAHIRSTRISEPKNYFGLAEPRGRTVLCAELPCAVGDELWQASDQAVADVVVEDLRRAGLPPCRPVAAFTRRLPHAYPVYTLGYEEPLARLQQWLDAQPGLLSYGRQGLFAHDNTHHALYMAYCAVDCLVGGRFDATAWAAHREVFATHVVED